MILLIAFAFLAGIVTVLSPCILPLLPIILSSTTAQDQKRPLGVVTGFVLSFTFFTLFLTSIVQWSGIPADSLRSLAILILAVFGLTLVWPGLQQKMEIWFSRLSRFAPTTNRSGFGGGLLVGFSLGLLWTPCVGPILAAVISLAITGAVTAQSALITLAYALGTALPLLLIMLAGSTALQRVPWLVRNTKHIQQAFGVLMILTAVAITFNLDRQFQTYILQTFPQYGVGLTGWEDTESIKLQLKDLTPQSEPKKEGNLMNLMQRDYPQAPELQVGGQWFNSEPLQLQDLRGKVVLVDFWTYSCINCQRTLPYLKDWWSKYQDDGLVIIGVHSPEFAFEHEAKNVQQAIDSFSLEYPIMQDNDFATWRAYQNRYWPAKYLIDAQGRVRYTHFGEGAYDETEAKIQELLEEAGSTVEVTINNPTYQIRSRTPELYLGSKRVEYLSTTETVQPGVWQEFSAPARLSAHHFGLQGQWKVTAEYAQPQPGGELRLNFEAQQVFLVARPVGEGGGEAGEGALVGGEGVPMEVWLDGEAVTEGGDFSDGLVNINGDRLYELVKLAKPGKHELRLVFPAGGVELYAFTFG